MTTQIKIQSTQHLTDDGKFGAWLFVIGPFVASAGYAWLISQDSSRNSDPNILWPSILILIGSAAFLFGCVLLVYGRSYNHNVQVSGPSKPPQVDTTTGPTSTGPTTENDKW